MNKEKLISNLLSVRPLPIHMRWKFCKLINRYLDCINAYATGELDFKQYSIYQRKNKEDLMDLFSDAIGSPYDVIHVTNLLEAGESKIVFEGADYEPEDVDTPCEICGKDRDGFTENLCEECFDNETDKFYDGGLDED